MNHLYNNNKMAKLVLFSTDCTLRTDIVHDRQFDTNCLILEGHEIGRCRNFGSGPDEIKTFDKIVS